MEDDHIRAVLIHPADGISIHVPRVEDDGADSLRVPREAIFQSTSPVWRTTTIRRKTMNNFIISIHVPRVEDDAYIPGDKEDEDISIHVPRVEDD